MITDFFNTGILVLMIVLVALPVGLAIARTLRQHAGRRRLRRGGGASAYTKGH